MYLTTGISSFLISSTYYENKTLYHSNVCVYTENNGHYNFIMKVNSTIFKYVQDLILI